VSSFAQAVPTSQTPTDQDPVATIHATTTLVEIPLLVLNQNGQIPERAPSPDSIQLRLGDGEWFRPNFVRQEGQDPIEVAILLDLTSRVSDLPRPLAQALASPGSLGLTSRDHVSLFVMDCSSVRVTNIPADPAQVDAAVRSAVDPPGQRGKSTCKDGGHLLDTLAAMSRLLRTAPSRRVILAITEGKDDTSAFSPKNLAELAQSCAVTIVQLNPTDTSTSAIFHGFPLIAEASGGTRLGIQAGTFRGSVRSAITSLRNRYIAQFHLPADEKAGRVAIAARIATAPVGTFQIRLTGNSIPLPSPDGSNPQVAQMGTAPAPNPAQPVVATTVEPPPGTAVPAPIAAGPSEPGHPAVPIPAQVVNETAGPAQVDESRVAKTDAAVQTRPSAPDSSVSTLKVNARLTLVDVTVTDKKGHPVHGLTQADFTVKEDGKEQSIKNFEALGGERPAKQAPPLPPDTYSNVPTLQPRTQAVNILLFDQVSTGISRGLLPSPETLGLFKEAADRYLKTMPTGTQVAVMTTDGSGLHLLQGFTTDRDLLIAAVNSIPHQLIPDARWDPAPFPPPCNAMNFQSAQALNSLNQVALFVSNIPGRKNLIWFTPGIGWLTDYAYFSKFKRLACVTDYTQQLQQVYGRLTAARVAAYPIDPRGIYTNPSGGAGESAPPPVWDGFNFSANVLLDTRSLEDMAKATGGKAHYSNNGLEDSLRDDVATGADYYALSYVPPLEKYDGKYHTIEVKVDRPGVQLEYRRGYTSLDINGPMLEQEKSHNASAPPKGAFETAMGYGAIPETQLRFTVKAVPSTAPRQPGDASVIGSLNAELKGKPLVRYSFAFDVPRDKITLEQQPDGSHKASFELAIAAYDVQGRVLNSLDEKRGLTLNQEAVAGFLQKPFVVPVEIDLPAGEVSVRAGVMDLPSEEIGVVEIPLKVAK